MSRAAVLALTAACSAPAAPRSAPVAPAAAPVLQAVPAASPVVRSDAAEGGVEAAPAGSIRMLAATPEGDAALTADQLHELRLWPALDGSVEPRIVELPEPHALALGRRGDGFTAAVIDAARGLYIARLDAQGRSRSHVSLAADPEWVGIAMSARGLVAWRADQSIVLLDGDGVALARLATEAGERIVAVAVTGDHAAVLLEHAGKRGVRTIALDNPAWGPWIDLASDKADLIALAPSGRIAVRDRDIAIVVDAAGKPIARIADAGGESLAFLDNAHLAMTARNTLVWLGDKASGPRPPATMPAIAAGGHVVSAAISDVLIATPAETKYLGYDVESPDLAQPVGDGQLAIGALAKTYTLDTQLRVASSRSLAEARLLGLRWLGDDAWAIETAADDVDLRLVSAGTARVVSKKLDDVYVLAYEPSTHLLTLSLGGAPMVYRHDPVKHELVRVAKAAAGPYEQVQLIPLAPARAGAELLRVTLGNETTVEWLPDASRLDKASASAKFRGALAAADPTGNVYGWESTANGMELVLFRSGKRVRSLPASGPNSVWPDPQGRRIAELATHAVSVITSDGDRVWSTPIERANTALWLSDGALAVVTRAGIVRLDPATGKALAARCGWGFGFSTGPHPPSPAIEPVCAQLEGGDQ